LAITFEWYVIGLSYFVCVFLKTRPFYWYKNFNVVYILTTKKGDMGMMIWTKYIIEDLMSEQFMM
jgi:hypothetical protein